MLNSGRTDRLITSLKDSMSRNDSLEAKLNKATTQLGEATAKLDETASRHAKALDDTTARHTE